MYLMSDLEDLWNHVGYVVLCLPDQFPVEDFLSDEDQMTMEKGYEQLHQGINIAYPPDQYKGKDYDDLRNHLASYLLESRKAYDMGDVVKGAHLLQDFRNAIFIKKGKVRYLK